MVWWNQISPVYGDYNIQVCVLCDAAATSAVGK